MGATAGTVGLTHEEGELHACWGIQHISYLRHEFLSARGGIFVNGYGLGKKVPVLGKSGLDRLSFLGMIWGDASLPAVGGGTGRAGHPYPNSDPWIPGSAGSSGGWPPTRRWLRGLRDARDVPGASRYLLFLSAKGKPGLRRDGQLEVVGGSLRRSSP